MDPQKITDLAKLLRNNGDKILNSEFTLTLSGSLLRALNDSFTLIADSLEIGDVHNFQVVKPINSKSPVFSDLQLVHDFVQKTALLCIIHYPGDECFEGKIDVAKFRALKRLEVQKINIKQIAGIQPLRAQLQHIICTKSIKCVDDIITHCGGDNSNGFVWNELKIVDFSYNNLQSVDSSLEFAQYLQHLNLRHNQLQSVKAIRWLPHLKTLDLSFNRLQHIPQFHMDAYKRLQSLNMSNNLVEDLMGIVKLDALTDLDLSDNCLMDHTYLLPLSAIDTLKFLNLFGNPLHCHPKHRLAVAQFLHKNCSTVKFILDFEPLSKYEKSLTGTQQLRQVGALNRYTMRSSSSSLSAPGRLTPSSNQTPASSVGSILSFKLADSSSDAELNAESLNSKQKMKSSKVRHVEIEDNFSEDNENKDSMDASEDVMNSSIISVTNTKTIVVNEEDQGHLEIKGQIVNLRKKYGSEWLKTSNTAEMMSSVLGQDSLNTPAVDIDIERLKSRQIFNEYIKDVTEDSTNTTNNLSDSGMLTSTPTNSTLDNTMANLGLTPIKSINNTNESSLYQSLEQTQTLVETTGITEPTLYVSMDVSNKINTNPFEEEDENESQHDEEHDNLKNVYTNNEENFDLEEEFSDHEDDEETYIVNNSNDNQAIFLTKSSNYLRERDRLTNRTKTKWSLKILESCDRIKSNTLRLNFDTVKKDKQERVYTVEEDLCQELEKQLRDILSQRDLTEMNQTIYRCVNCSCQFSQEIKYNQSNAAIIRCPDCKSSFVAEIHNIPKSLEKAGLLDKLSPASIVEELPTSITPLTLKQPPSRSTSLEMADETNSIGKGNTRLSAINPLHSRTLKQNLKSSANSLNESSCSKITTRSRSESSFNSNQSLVGSTNTDRDLDFKTNGESDVDIISNPSQSSIEVLDHYASRKTSEDRRSIAHIPNLETIDDQSYTQTFLEREFDNMINYAHKDQGKLEDACADQEQQLPADLTEQQLPVKKSITAVATNNLTESSSSGSVTDSICTAYEQKSEKTKDVNTTFKQHEASGNQAAEFNKKEDSNGLTSMFGALIQSTNILMASSKKFIDSETNVKSGAVLPAEAANSSKDTIKKSASTTNTKSLYKFNYTDFNDIDHRLKLYFYQSKFEEKGEHFKWIIKGRIFNENTQKLTEGIVVMSTCKLYVMEAFASENDDVGKWLRPITSCTVDRLDTIQLLPWKIGLSVYIRDWGGFLLLLQDIIRTDSLMLFFANNSLPSACELKYQPGEKILKRLSAAVIDEQLNMCSLLNGCEISCENAKRSFNICALLTTDSRLYLSSDRIGWLSELDADSDIELCVTQFMSNLVEVERCSDNVFIVNFLDETQDKCELWKCTFETAENAYTCLNAIAQSWEKLFGVPLINT